MDEEAFDSRDACRPRLPATALASSKLNLSESGTAPQSTAAPIWANWGVYEWDVSIEAWVLVEQGWDDFAEYATAEAGDELVESTVFQRTTLDPNPPSPGGPIVHHSVPGAGMGIASSSTETTDMPRVVAHGVRPSNFGYNTMFLLRPVRIRDAIGGGLGRRARQAIKEEHTLSCQNQEIDRYISAHSRLKNQPRGLYVIRYAGGGRQVWAVTQPNFTDLGLQPASTCSSSP